jgi:gliding motility-associated protein GldM
MAGTTNPLRQQMINMMYLVLTALLALNVSADILKAFALVNGGLERTNGDYNTKNSSTMDAFAKLYDLNQAKAEKVYNNAKAANAYANQVYNDLQRIKEMLAREAKGWLDSTKVAVEEDQNLEIAENYFVTKEKGKYGIELRKKLDDFQKKMRDFVIDEKGNKMPNAVSFQIDVLEKRKDKEGTEKKWHEYYFQGVPVIAAITEITKFQNDVRNAQSEVSKVLMSQVGQADFKFDNLVAIVKSETPAVYAGQEYKAEIFLGAYSSTQNPTIIANGSAHKVEAGKATYTVGTAGSTGEKSLSGKIEVTDPSGEKKVYPFETKYQVFTGAAVISADQMNVLYRGLDNPMSVSVPGFSDKDVIVGWGGLPATKVGPGKFKVKPTAGTAAKCTVTVSAKMPNGSTKGMGSQVYRVRNIPRAEVLFGGKPGGPISKGEILTVRSINAGLGPEFAFEGLKYKVLGYTIVVSPRAGGQAPYIENITGNAVTGNAQARLQSVRTGDIIVIANVNVDGPAGKQTLVGTSLTVK